MESFRAGDGCTVQLTGRLDRSHREKFAPAIEEAKRSGAKEICFDLASISGFDSLGVASLIEAIGWGKRQGIEVRLQISPSPEGVASHPNMIIVASG